MGVHTSAYNKRKKLTEEQKRRNEHAIKKLQDMDKQRKKKTSWKFHNSYFNARHFYMHIAQWNYNGFECDFSAHFIYVFSWVLWPPEISVSLTDCSYPEFSGYPEYVSDILTLQEYYYYVLVLALCGLYGPVRVLEYKYIYFALTAHNKPCMCLLSS